MGLGVITLHIFATKKRLKGVLLAHSPNTCNATFINKLRDTNRASVKALFEDMCPNCGGEITDDRLRYGLPCEKCLPNADNLKKLHGVLSMKEFHRAIADALREVGTLSGYEEVVKMDEASSSFSSFFESITGEKPWREQELWAVRVLNGESFALIAPPGVGKSVFSEVMALFMASRGKRVIYVTPTTLLASQVSSKLRVFSKELGIKVGEISSSVSKKDSGKPSDDVVVLTSAGLRVHFGELSAFRFDIAFVDDVDAVLRSSKNVERLLMLLGYTRDELDTAMKYAFKRISAFRLARRDPEASRNALREAEELRRQLPRRSAQVVLSSATAKPKGKGALLLGSLLGMEVEGGLGGTRNVVDVKLRGDLVVTTIEEVKRLGPGGLVFVSHDLGSGFAKQLTDSALAAGLKVGYAEGRKSVKLMSRFEKGEVHALIGMASYYGPLVRGLDLPVAVRYALFVGVPKFMFKISGDETNPFRISQILWELGSALDDQKAKKLASEIRRMLRPLSQEEFRRVENLVKANEYSIDSDEQVKDKGEGGDYLRQLLSKIKEAKEELSSLFSKPGAIDALKRSPRLLIKEKGGSLYLVVPDLMTYLQASGRTSRIGKEGFTTGISEVVIDDEAAMAALERQAKLYFQDVQWREVNDVDWNALLSRMAQERNGGLGVKPESPFLMIVESPNKARTISSFFGKSTRKTSGEVVAYEVNINRHPVTIVATGGHLLDLPTPGQGEFGVKLINGEYFPSFTTIKKCMSCGLTFTEGNVCPACGSTYIRDSAGTIKVLRKLALEADRVYICTDPDVEGEKIAWDLYMVLSPFNPNIVRAAFHEITKTAVLEALADPRSVDERLTEAQAVRRVDDRWVAFYVGKTLREIQEKGFPVATGRVQGPALDWIVRRYQERELYTHSYLTLNLKPNGIRIVLELPKELDKKTCTAAFQGAEATVITTEEKEEESEPMPPFTTDELLQAAAFTLKMGVTETMRTAQELFEAGLITYHRTSSIHVSTTGMNVAKAYIDGRWGEEGKSLYQPRGWGPEGAHEAIRPTRPMGEEELKNAVEEGIIRLPFELRWPHYALYSLIFKRFIQSQMAPARYVKQKFRILIKPKWSRGAMESSGELLTSVISKGWMGLGEIKTKDPLSVGTSMTCEVTGFRRGSEPGKGILTEGALVAMMKKKGIGKPSTYASTVERLKKHGYVISRGKLSYLIPTARGIALDGVLNKAFPELVSDEMTRKLVETMDGVESGMYNYQEVLSKIHEEILRACDQAKVLLASFGGSS